MLFMSFRAPCGRSAKNVSARTAHGAVWCVGNNPRAASVRVAAMGTGPAQAAADDEYCSKRYKAEFHMMYSRLGGVVQQVVAAAVLGGLSKADGRMAARGVHTVATAAAVRRVPPAATSTAASAAAGTLLSPFTPAGMAAAFLRNLDSQLQAKKYMSDGDEAGDVLGSFPSASLFYYPGGGLQSALEHLAAAATELRGPAAPAAAAVIRSLAGAVGRLAAQPNAEAAQGKAAAVITCLDGMAEALEGATKGDAVAMYGEAGAVTASGAASLSESDLKAEAVTASLESGQLLREVAAVMDCIAGGSPDLPASHTGGGHTLSPSSPVHPLLSVLETRMYSDSTWRSDSAAEIAAGLVDFVAALLVPSRAGNTSAAVSTVARGACCSALHSLARAQRGLAAALQAHRAEPAVISRLLAALAEALAAACITRDAGNPSCGPSPVAMFGEAQVLMGLARMAAGEAIAVAVAPGSPAAAARAASAAMAADAAAGDASLDRKLFVSDSRLVLEVLAAQAQEVAATHCDHIAQVLKDLRDIPSSLGTLSETLPLAATAASAAEDLVRQTTAGSSAAVVDEAAAAVAADNQAAAGGGAIRGTRAPGASPGAEKNVASSL